MQVHTTAYRQYDDALATLSLSRERFEHWSRIRAEMGWSKAYAKTQLGAEPTRFTNIVHITSDMGASIHKALTSSRFNGRGNRSVLQYGLVYPAPTIELDIHLLALDTNSSMLRSVQEEYARRGYEGEIFWFRSYGENPIREELKTQFLIERLWNEADGKENPNSVRRGNDTSSSVAN